MKNQLLLFIFLILLLKPLFADDKKKLLLEGITDNEFFTLSLYPEKDNVLIGDYHNWIIEVKDANGIAVSDALFSLSGGMAAHGHGLPSQPQVTQYLGEGRYLIEGMLFNMAGQWGLFILIENKNAGDRKQFDITLSF